MPLPRASIPSAKMLLATAGAIAMATGAGIALSNHADTGAVIWFASGILLAVLLVTDTQRWPALLATGWATTMLVHVAAGDGIMRPAALATAEAAGVLLAAAMLRRGRATTPDLAEPAQLLRFALVGVLLAPAVSALAAFGLLFVQDPGIVGPRLSRTLLGWFLADALGLAIMAPLGLSLLGGELQRSFRGLQRWPTLAWLLGYAALTALVFGQTTRPMVYLSFPLLMAVVVMLGFAGTGLVMLITAVIAIGCTVHGHGPIMLVAGFSMQERMLFAQLFLAVACGTAYPVAAITGERRRVNLELADKHALLGESERLYRLLADHSSDIITRVSFRGQPRYVSPAVTEVLGWTAEEMSREDWERMVHPDDLPAIRAGREQMRQGLLARSTSCARFLRKDGSWAWLEARVHLVRDALGEPEELVCNLRDVTRQKQAEARLDAAMNALAEQATTDGLTGLANRRRFDDVLAHAWARARRTGIPVALMMIDADHFKNYNDCHGHQAGDECLRAIADAIAGSVRSPYDLPARYGGEEFSVILPATDLNTALRIAGRTRAAVAALSRPHLANPAGVVTVSIGVAAMVPLPDADPARLLGAADGALYEAKRGGRNRIEPATGFLAQWQRLAG